MNITTTSRLVLITLAVFAAFTLMFLISYAIDINESPATCVDRTLTANNTIVSYHRAC